MGSFQNTQVPGPDPLTDYAERPRKLLVLGRTWAEVHMVRTPCPKQRTAGSRSQHSWDTAGSQTGASDSTRGPAPARGHSVPLAIQGASALWPEGRTLTLESESPGPNPTSATGRLNSSPWTSLTSLGPQAFFWGPGTCLRPQSSRDTDPHSEDRSRSINATSSLLTNFSSYV